MGRSGRRGRRGGRGAGTPPRPTPELRERLDALVRTYDRAFVETDPLRYVHRFADPLDQELVGLLASSLAYGTVQGIFGSVERVLAVLGPRPADAVRELGPARLTAALGSFKHRWTTGADVACLLAGAARVQAAHGTLGAAFTGHHRGGAGGRRDPAPGPEGPRLARSLGGFVGELLSLDASPFYGEPAVPARAGVRYLLPDPARGSACKRLLLYLRWMVRGGDGIDLGLWTDVDPADLLIPLDTHVARISHRLGLTRSPQPSWRRAEEVTAVLRGFAPADPVRYDFAICRLGILDRCPARPTPVACSGCGLADVCVHGPS